MIIFLVKVYVKSPTWKDKARLTFSLVLVPISVGAVLLTKESWGFIILTDPTTTYRLGAILPFFLVFFTVHLIFISFAAYKKKGFGNLKKFSEDGIVGGLIDGIICGLIVWFIFGLIDGLAHRLIVGLVYGLVTKWMNEFHKQSTQP